MKYTILLAMTLLFSNLSFAEGETETECPWMREDTSRSNPKSNSVKEKPKSDESSTAIQQ
jgi:hypothetical protein